jgi:uncharacterized membrane protein (GlpM family)
MNQFLFLLAGIALAAPLFAALLYSLAQAIRHAGALRTTHLVAIAATFAGMAFLSWGWPFPTRAAGAALALAGLRLVFLEAGWNRLLPGVQMAAGLVLAAGLPFAG